MVRPLLRKAISCRRRRSSRSSRRRLEDRRVGPEGDRRAGLAGRLALVAAGRGLASRRSAAVQTLPSRLISTSSSVDSALTTRDADAVQTAGDGVGLAVELAARVQRGHDHLDGGPLLDRVHVDRDAAAVVGDRDAAVGQQGDLDRGGVAGHRLVDGVVDDLPDQVVQAALAGGADVHAGPLADRLEPLEDGDGRRAVVVLLRGHGPRCLPLFFFRSCKLVTGKCPPTLILTGDFPP